MQTFDALIYARICHLQQDPITLFKRAFYCADKTQAEVSYRHTSALNPLVSSYLQPKDINLVKRAYYAKQSLQTSPHGELSCRP